MADETIKIPKVDREIREFYTTDTLEERMKCLSCAKMFDAGASKDEVALALGISKQSAAGYLRRYRERKQGEGNRYDHDAR